MVMGMETLHARAALSGSSSKTHVGHHVDYRDGRVTRGE